MVEADGQKRLKLTWPAVQNKRGSHDIMGYLVQIAAAADGTTTFNAATPRPGADADGTSNVWTSLTIIDNTATTTVDESKPYSVPADTLTYTYDGNPRRLS